jgi:hypothetical protein
MRLGALGQQGPQLLGLGHDGRGRPHGDPAAVEGDLDRCVLRLGEGLRHGDQLTGTTGPHRGSPLAHPPHRRGGSGAASRLPARQCLAHHRHPRRVTGRAQVVDDAEEGAELARSCPPQLGVEALERLAGGRETLASLLQRQDPLHDLHCRCDH